LGIGIKKNTTDPRFLCVEKKNHEGNITWRKKRNARGSTIIKITIRVGKRQTLIGKGKFTSLSYKGQKKKRRKRGSTRNLKKAKNSERRGAVGENSGKYISASQKAQKKTNHHSSRTDD